MELIDRQAAIEQIMMRHTGMPFVRSNVRKWSEENRQYLECENILRGLPTIEERKEKWIPCIVEKPKKTGYYICTCHDGVCYRTSVLVWSTGWVLTGVGAYWRVIAWMPLPKPWRGEGDE